MFNPSLRQEPREQKAPIIETKADTSILHWLEGTGRLMERDSTSDFAEKSEIDPISVLGTEDEEEDSFNSDDDSED